MGRALASDAARWETIMVDEFGEHAPLYHPSSSSSDSSSLSSSSVDKSLGGEPEGEEQFPPDEIVARDKLLAKSLEANQKLRKQLELAKQRETEREAKNQPGAGKQRLTSQPSDFQRNLDQQNEEMRRQLQEYAEREDLEIGQMSGDLFPASKSEIARRRILLAKFAGMRGAHGMKTDVLERLEQGLPVMLKEMLPDKNKLSLGEEEVIKPGDVSRERWADLMQQLISYYAVHFPQHLRDMHAHFSLAQSLFETNTVNSVIQWSHAVVGQCELGCWDKSVAKMDLAFRYLRALPTRNRQNKSPSSTQQSAGNKENTTPSQRRRSRKGRLASRFCFDWAGGNCQRPQGRCRFVHGCPVCPSRPDHLQKDYPSKTSELWAQN
eukprot:gb/GEZN01001681.1/.p1 GENE.gb/GEZN01001681.1/~~gb/GEZN01001681.1/.p1  ORF type:complete len:380 (+),score=46.22 gb/GEZN01001681.1/:627-1766(+)